MRALLIILVLDVHEEGFDIFGFGVGAVLIESQVVVGELAFTAADFLDESLVFAFEVDVGRVVLIDVFDLLLHLLNLACDFDILILEQVAVVIAIVDLAPRA